MADNTKREHQFPVGTAPFYAGDAMSLMLRAERANFGKSPENNLLYVGGNAYVVYPDGDERAKDRIVGRPLPRPVPESYA